MPANSIPDRQGWKVEACKVVTHGTTGLRFFVWDNIETRQTEFVTLNHFADRAVIEDEARAAGLSVEDYTDRLGEQAMEAAERRK